MTSGQGEQGQSLSGWRVWTLSRAGTFPRSRRDRHDSLLWSECLTGHEAPDPDCACGLSLVLDLHNLLYAIEHRPWTCELHPLRAISRGGGLLDALRVSHRPDLFGHCSTYGNVQPSAAATDPHGTVRCEALRINALYLLPHAAHHLPALADDTGVTPTVTTLLDLGGQLGHSHVEAVGSPYESGARS